MRKMIFLGLILLMVASISAEAPLGQDYNWLTETDWALEMTDEGDYIYWNQQPYGCFRKNMIPKENAIYRRWLPTKYFNYFYPFGNDNMVRVGFDHDKDGKDDVLDIYSRDNRTVFFIEDSETGFLLGGGIRDGEIIDERHPFAGIWTNGKNFSSEVRLVAPAKYQLFLEITKVPGFGIREGWYLLKQISRTLFESDSTWPDGHIRIEVLSKTELLLTPLFKLPKEEGRVEPLKMRAIGKRSVPGEKP